MWWRRILDVMVRIFPSEEGFSTSTLQKSFESPT